MATGYGDFWAMCGSDMKSAPEDLGWGRTRSAVRSIIADEGEAEQFGRTWKRLGQIGGARWKREPKPGDFPSVGSGTVFTTAGFDCAEVSHLLTHITALIC